MSSISISKITLQNYRQFTNASITFQYIHGKKNIAIIEGSNGVGKSNIFNAINWCLFETEAHLGENSQGMPLCNTSILKALDLNKSAEVKVTILLDTPKGKLEISRIANAFMNSDGNEYRGTRSQLQVSQYTKTGNKILPNPEDTIARILPKSMSHFFFIDGEQLRTMFTSINKDEIKDSIFELSQINMLQSAISHLGSLKSDFRPKEKQVDGITLAYQVAIENSKKQIDQWTVDYDKEKEDLNGAKKRKQQIDIDLGNIGIDELKKLIFQRDSSEKKVEELRQRIDEQEREYYEFLQATASLFLFKKALKTTAKSIASLEKEKRIPPKIDLEFLKELIERQTCICGCSLKDNSGALHKLEALAADMKMSGIANLVSDIKYAIRDINSRSSAPETKERFYKFPHKIRELNDSLADTQKQTEEISKKISNLDENHVTELDRLRRQLSERLSEGTRKLGFLESNIRREKERLSAAEVEYRKILAKDSKNKLSLLRLNKCDEAITVLNQLKEKLMSEIRADAEVHTREYFNKLITAKDFTAPEITTDYELKLKNKDGFNVIHNLSAAETLCMGYSFMAALRKTSGFMAPIVIDTPLAKIDKEYRLNVAEWINKALPDAQVILLVTNSEYTSDFAAALKNRIGSSLQIVHHKQDGISEVKDA